MSKYESRRITQPTTIFEGNIAEVKIPHDDIWDANFAEEFYNTLHDILDIRKNINRKAVTKYITKKLKALKANYTEELIFKLVSEDNRRGHIIENENKLLGSIYLCKDINYPRHMFINKGFIEITMQDILPKNMANGFMYEKGEDLYFVQAEPHFSNHTLYNCVKLNKKKVYDMLELPTMSLF